MLILASASQSRKKLLENSDIEFSQIPSSFDESIIKEKNVCDLAFKLSFYKAKSVVKKIEKINSNKTFSHSTFEILGCDSIFEFKGKAFGKPVNKKDAYERWLEISSGFGYLHTGHSLLFCKFSNNNKILIKQVSREVVTSKIFFCKLEEREISKYVDSLEPLYCAGGFALEGKGGKYIEKIEGCYSNVIGLSLPWLRKKLLEKDIMA